MMPRHGRKADTTGLSDDDIVTPERGARSTWSSGKLIAFRFVFAYFGIYAFPFFLDLAFFDNSISNGYKTMWHVIVVWTAKHVLHLAHDITVFENGSGDTTYNWIQLVCFMAIAGIATVIWSVLDRRRRNYNRLQAWFRLYLRTYVGLYLIAYGAFKVIPNQFSEPSLEKLVETFGESSPMGLLWTFMGASYAYVIISGLVEMLAGILLIVPSTTTLGALISIGAVGNVFVLNMAYDTPVKQFSFHLLIMSAFIALPDLRRLARFFIFNRNTEPVLSTPLFQRRGLNTAVVWVQLTAMVAYGCLLLYVSGSTLKPRRAMRADAHLRGIWSVDDFTKDGKVRPPLLTDGERWRRVIYDLSSNLDIQFMDDIEHGYAVKLDATNGTMHLTRDSDPKWSAALHYEIPQPDVMKLKGQWGGHEIDATLHRKDISKLELTSRGFHWINEHPYQR